MTKLYKPGSPGEVIEFEVVKETPKQVKVRGGEYSNIRTVSKERLNTEGFYETPWEACVSQVAASNKSIRRHLTWLTEAQKALATWEQALAATERV